jgi:hypothetical protein
VFVLRPQPAPSIFILRIIISLRLKGIPQIATGESADTIDPDQCFPMTLRQRTASSILAPTVRAIAPTAPAIGQAPTCPFFLLFARPSSAIYWLQRPVVTMRFFLM